MGDPPTLASDHKAILCVPFQWRKRKDLGPGRLDQLRRRWIARDGAGLHRAGLRIVAPKVSGIDGHAPEHARQAEPDDAPVVAGLAPATGLPAVHPLADIRVFTLSPDGLASLEE